MTLSRKILAAVIALFFLFPPFSIAAFGKEEASPAERYQETNGATLCAARKGYWRNSAENSLQAIADAVSLGADIVEIDIKKTEDGVFILMADDTVTRTCYGYTEKTAVADMTFSEISELRLLKGEGGAVAEKTEYTVPSLAEVFQNKQNCLYLLDAAWEWRDELYALAEQYDCLSSVIFLVRNIRTEELIEWKDSLPTEPMIMTYYKGNVIFSALSAVKRSAAAGAEGIYLATRVPYGIIFGDTVMNKAGGSLRAMANAAEAALCGTIREDNEIWWDDLISRGYNILLTDHVPELKAYLQDCEEKKLVLQEIYDETVQNWTLPDFTADKYFDYKLAYNNAKSFSETLLGSGSCARSDLVKAAYELQKAYDDIRNNYAELENGTAGMTVTPIRILLAVLAVAAVSAAEILVYRMKRKE